MKNRPNLFVIWTQLFYTQLKMLLQNRPEFYEKNKNKKSLFCCMICIFLKEKYQDMIVTIAF